MVECTGLENRRTLTRTVGSNPTSSAMIIKFITLNQLLAGKIDFPPPQSPPQIHLQPIVPRSLLRLTVFDFLFS